MLLSVKDLFLREKLFVDLIVDCRLIEQGYFPEKAWETDIYITRRCNISCSYCYINDYFPGSQIFKDPTLDKIKNIIEQLAGKTHCLVILGGEPLIRKDLPDILKYAKDKGIPSNRIASNGIFIKKQLEALKYIDRLNISIDSTRIREYPHQIEQMMKDIVDVKNEILDDFPELCIGYTLTQDEKFERDILPVVKYAIENDFDVKFLPCKYVDKILNWDQLRDVVEKCHNYISDVNKLINIKGLVDKGNSEFLFNNCLQKIQYYIDFDGYFLYPCDEYPENKVGKIFDHPIDELWNMGVKKFGMYPDKNSEVCMNCKSYCHAENSYNYQNPERQFQKFS